MLVFWKARLVLLSVPKTGTTAYQAALAPHASLVVSDPPELKHAPVYRYNRFFRPMFEKVGAPDMALMAVVREPVDWLGSWYRYRQRPFLDGKPASTAGISFDDFVDAYSTGDPPAFANVGSQAKFVEPRPNGVSVTHLFRYEDQDRIRGFLSDRLGVALDLPQRNVSPRATLELSPGVEAKLHRKCAADFALWDSAGA
ncbi:gamma-glutamyl kinase [Thalassococcus sp. CAU 1522]|uniref:Gamma-glutamyl kinase n=1 Tax=Thalassococcus arenae TaxID=2851652 RepID=A0ABS6N9T9_9RHOB|nr:gamma-glutamyl kinase [Thalassococcus arenae]MBV2360776.1 gamma-glutamyl kinase [Thalassococcus arenae]